MPTPTAIAGLLRHALMASACTATLLSGANTAWAQATQARIQAKEQINIGYRADAAPFSFEPRPGEAAGYMVDLCRKIADQAGAQAKNPPRVNLVPVPVDQINRYLQAGTVDLFCSATTVTGERRKSMDFSAPVFISAIRLLVRQSDGVERMEQLAGKPVVVIGRTTADTALAQRRATMQWDVTRALNPEAALSQLQMGWAQAYARDDVLLLAQIAQTDNAQHYKLLPEALSREEIAIAFGRNDAGWSTLVNGVITGLVRSGEMQALYDRWFVQPTAVHPRGLNLPMSAELKTALDRLR